MKRLAELLRHPLDATRISRRGWRIMSYVAWVAIGVMDIFQPSRSISHTADPSLARTWAVMILACAIGTLAGSVTKRVVLEYVSLPGMAGCFVFWAVCIIAYELPEAPNAIAPDFLMVAAALSAIARFAELSELVRESRRGPGA